MFSFEPNIIEQARMNLTQNTNTKMYMITSIVISMLIPQGPNSSFF